MEVTQKRHESSHRLLIDLAQAAAHRRFDRAGRLRVLLLKQSKVGAEHDEHSGVGGRGTVAVRRPSPMSAISPKKPPGRPKGAQIHAAGGEDRLPFPSTKKE